MSTSDTGLKSLVGMQTYTEASLLGPDAVPRPPVDRLCPPPTYPSLRAGPPIHLAHLNSSVQDP